MSVDWQQHDQSEHGLFILDIIINAQNVLWMMVVMMCVNVAMQQPKIAQCLWLNEVYQIKGLLKLNPLQFISLKSDQ